MATGNGALLAPLAARTGDLISAKEFHALFPQGPISHSLNQPRGIFKPADSELALWVRSTLKGRKRYQDTDPEIIDEDGRWRMVYHAEDRDGKPAPSLATNRGLDTCLERGEPIGVIKEILGPSGGSNYEVLGVARVIERGTGPQGDFYILEGDAIDASRSSDRAVPLEHAEISVFDRHPGRRLMSRVSRPLQPIFRSRVLAAYRERCALCGFGVRVGGEPRGLEAAHIIPHPLGSSRTVRNGMALCANHHSLFDPPSWGWALKPDYTVEIGSDFDLTRSAATNCLPRIEGQIPEFMPKNERLWPDKAALEYRFNEFRKHQPSD